MRRLVESDVQSSEEESDSDEHYCENIETVDDLKIVNKSALNWILKNCKSIRDLNLTQCLFDKEVIDLICIYCPNLVSLKFTDSGSEEKDMINLGQNCGQSLEKLVVSEVFGSKTFSLRCLLNYCSNLKFFNNRIDSITGRKQTVLPKLEVLKINDILEEKHISRMHLMAKQYGQRLKSLEIEFEFKSGKFLLKALKTIASFKNLEKLDLKISKPVKDLRSIDEKLKEIAVNCLNIKTLHLDLDSCGHQLIAGNLFNVFGMFRNLEFLNVDLPEPQLIIKDESDIDDFEVEYIFKLNDEIKNARIESFKDCQKLDTITLSFSQIDDKFLKDIEIYLPNLKAIHIQTSCDIRDDSMIAFSKLKSLKTLFITKNHSVDDDFFGITDNGLCALINSCAKINFISFMGRLNISHNSIDSLRAKALMNPKINYYFSCVWFESRRDRDYAPLDVESFDNLPNNLKINFGSAVNSDEEFDCSSDEYSDEDSDEDLLQLIDRFEMLRVLQQRINRTNHY
jgi:hypothetical protein